MTSPGGGSRQVRIVIAADVASAINGFRQVQEGLRGVGQQGQQTTQVTSSFGEKLQQGLANVGISTGFDGIIGGFKSIVASGMDYDRAMNTFQAVTGASDAQMKSVGETAKALGNDIQLPGATAQSTAAAMTELAKGGLKADEAMAAARGTLTLAAAAQIDGAQAAEIQASSLNTFGLAADQANRVADVLANTANASAGEITDFAQGMQQAGTIANAFGWSIEDTSTMLGLMANAGIKGSDAGTSLKTTMTALLNPTEKQAAALGELGVKTTDANGKMVSAKDFTDQLAAAKGRMTDAEFSAAAATAFGTDAVRTALVAAQAGGDGYDKMSDSIHKVGGAQDVAAANSKGLVGAVENLASTAQTAGQTMYETFAPAMERAANIGVVLAQKLGELATWFGTLPGPIQATATALVGVAVLGSPLRAMSASVALFGRNVTMAMSGSTNAIRGAGAGLAGFILQLRAAQGAAATFGIVAKGAMSFLGSGIGLAIIGVTTALSFMSSTTDDATVSTASFSGAIDENTGKLVKNADAIIKKAAADAGSYDAVEAIGGSVQVYTQALMDSASGIDAATGAQAQMSTLLQQSAVDALNTSSAFDEYTASGGTAYKTVDEMAAAILAGTDVNIVHTDSLDAVIRASQRYAADTDNLGTVQRHTNQAATEGTGAVDSAGNAMDGAAGSAQGLADGVDDAGSAFQAGGSSATTFKTKVEQSKSAMDAAALAAQGFSLNLLQMQGTDLNAEQAARANDAAMRGMASAARSHAAALDDVTKREQDLEDLRAHGKSSPEALAQAQERLDKATQDAADAQSELTKQQAQSADDSAKAREALDKTQTKNARSLADAQKALNKATAQSQKDLKDAQAKARDAEAAAKAAAADLRKAQSEPDKAAADKLAKARAEAVKTAAALKAVQTEKPSTTTPERHKRDLALATERAKAAAAAVKAAESGLTGANSDRVAKAKEKAKQTQDALAKAREGVADAKANGTESVAAAEQSLKDATEQAADARIAAEEAVTKAAESAADQETAAKKRITDASASVQKAQQDLQAVQQASIPTQSDLAAAERAVADAKSQVAASADAQKTAEEAAAQSARDMASAAGATALANGDLETASKNSTTEMEKQRQKFIDAAVAAGMPIEAAKALATELGLVPEDVKPTIELEGAEIAIAKAAILQAMLNKIPEGVYKANITAGFTNIEGTYDPILQKNRNQRYTNDAGTYDPALQHARNNAAGGFQVGPGGGTDDKILSKLSNGEFVVNAKATAKHRALLHAINDGLPAFAAGGAVGGGRSGKTGGVSMGVSASGEIALPDADTFRKTWEDIANSVIKPWHAQIQPVLDEIVSKAIDTGDSQQNLLKKSVQPSWAGIGQTIGDTWSEVSPMLTGFGATAAGVGAMNLDLRDKAIMPAWAGIGSTVAATAGSVLGNFGALEHGTTIVGEGNLDLHSKSVAPAWKGIGTTIGSAVNNLQTGLFPQFSSGLSGLGADNNRLSMDTKGSWGRIGSSINSAYTSAIVPAWAGIRGFGAAIGAFFDGIAFGSAKAKITMAKDLTEITKAIDGFFKMIDGKTATPSGVGATIGAAAGAAIPKFADGGLITAGTGPRTDDVHIRASKGEYVVNARATARNKSALDAINYGGAYADGGLIGEKIGTRISDAITRGTQRAIEAGVEKAITAGPSYGPGGTVNGVALPGISGPRGKFLEAVASQMGTPYVWGGATPPGFDCSGLMSWALGQAGVGKGRLTAADFNHGFPHISVAKPGDMVTFDTGRIPGDAGHIGAVLDPAKGLMMHTDGAGPARVGDYKSRDGGPLSIIDPIGGAVVPSKSANASAGDPPSGGNWLAKMLDRIKTGTAANGAFSSAPFADLDAEQASNARAIASVAAGRGLGHNGVLVGIVTAITEATLRNVAHGDAMGPSSTGLFQQMPPWGPYEVRMSPTGSAGLFYDALTRIPGYQSMSIPMQAQSVEQSEFSDGSNYASNMAWAEQVTKGLGFANGGIVGGGNTPGNDSVWAKASPGEAFLTHNQWATTKSAAHAVNQMARGASQNVVVNARVFVGDREITDIVRVETDTAMGNLATAINRGRLQTV